MICIMKTIQISQRVLCVLLILTANRSFSQSTLHRRFEIEAVGGVLQLPAPYRTGWFAGQQLTGYVHPRIGIALGLNWANSANLDPLSTRNPDENDGFVFLKPDPTELLKFYQRQEQMTNLSVVFLPVLTRRHQIKAQIGLSAYRRREFGVDRIVYPQPRDRSNYLEVPRLINSRRVVPMAAVGYDFRLSDRWAVGLNATTYFTGAARPTSTLGLRTAYRFNLSADSLATKPIDWSGLRTGVRLAANVVNRSGSAGRSYRTRFVGGLWAELPLSLTWAARGEINYAQRGYCVKEIQSNGRVLPAFGNLNYLELPLLFRHEVAYRWHLYGGPYAAFFLNGYRESDGQRNAPVQSHAVTGLALGTSYAFTDRFAADLRYQTDLITLSSTPYGGFHSFQAGLSYAIGSKR